MKKHTKKNRLGGTEMRSKFSAIALLAALSLLTACGGGGDNDPFGGTSGAGSGETGSGTSAANIDSVIISYPESNAIQDLTNGFYLRKAAIAVTDKNGRPAADGTRVKLRMIDSVIVQGDVIDGGPDIISGTRLEIPSAVQTDGTLAGNRLTTVEVQRPFIQGGSHRTIQAGDTVLLQGATHYKDVLRDVQGPPGEIHALEITSAFEEAYPAYDDVSYLVGASMLGTAILGESEQGYIPGEGVVSGGTGIATVWIRYPSNVNYIRSGCNPLVDDRITPVGSGQVYLAATAGDITAVEQFCFSTIAGYELSPDTTTYKVISPWSGTTQICVEDGGDKVAVPFSSIDYWRADGTAAATVSLAGTVGGVYTNRYGCFTAVFTNVNGISGDTGTWVFQVGDGTASVTVEIL